MTDIIQSNTLSTAGNAPDGDIKWVRNAADVTRLVNEGSQGRANARIVIGIALGGIFLDAYDLGALAFGIKDITREFNLTPAGTGMVASAITFGAIVGALIGGYLTDKIGRYR
jgi:predicted MFS family arabinose efflux permease